MKKSVLSLSILALMCSTTLPLQAEETPVAVVAAQEIDLNDDLKAVCVKPFLHSKLEPFLNMLAAQALQSSGKVMDAEDLIAKFREALNSPETLAKLAEPYLSVFSADEIHEIRKMHESPIYEKYMLNSEKFFQPTMMTMSEVFNELVAKYGSEPKAAEPVATNIIEVTKENFDEVVTHAEKPLIIDVYSTSCGPCRMMEPILKDLSNQYKDSVQFVKINCDTQPELAVKYGVTALPTLLFVKPGEEAVVLKTTGFTSKKDLNEKIVQFVQ